MNVLQQRTDAGAVPLTARSPMVVCATLAHNPSWKWFAPIFEQIRWEFFGASPRSLLERKIQRPALASWRACWDAASRAQHARASLLVSHDGRVTFRTAQAARLQRTRVPHLAWGFNFTTLPGGLQRRLMTSAFKQVDRFVTYCSMERSLYAEYFDIDDRRIDVMLWGVGQPLVEPADTPLEPGDYICALGGNARDYRSLFAAMELVPDIPLIAILRPENVAGLKVPSNVRLQFKVKRGNANNILAYSRFMVLPLAGSAVPCGHVTLVAAMHLKKAMIITNSTGVADYVQDGVNSLIVPVGEVDALSARIRELWDNPERAAQMGGAGHAFAVAHCSEEQVIDHLRKVLNDYGLPV